MAEQLYRTNLGATVDLSRVDRVTGIKRIEDRRPGGYFVYRVEYKIVYKDGSTSLVDLVAHTTKEQVRTSETWWSKEEQALKEDWNDLMKKVQDYGYFRIGLPEN